MTPKLLTFIRLLREQGVRLSVAESLDALHSVSRVGVQDRELLRLTLRTTLVKAQNDFATFDALFERFFPLPPSRRRPQTPPRHAQLHGSHRLRRNDSQPHKKAHRRQNTRNLLPLSMPGSSNSRPTPCPHLPSHTSGAIIQLIPALIGNFLPIVWLTCIATWSAWWRAC